MKNNFFFKDPFSNIYKDPSKLSEITSQILYGEKFKILLRKKKWIKIKTLFDNYVGYIIYKKNFAIHHKPTHKVSSVKANIYDKKFVQKKYSLPFVSKISKINENKNFIEFEKNRWIKKKDVKTIDHKEKKFFNIAKLFLNTKYIWGGKTYKGIDCSAILQLFFYYNDKFFPRDTKDQIKFSKRNKENKNFKEEDIIFWKGHVAICVDSKKLIHAYGPKKKVLIMLIKETISLIKITANLVVKKISSIKY